VIVEALDESLVTLRGRLGDLLILGIVFIKNDNGPKDGEEDDKEDESHVRKGSRVLGGEEGRGKI